MSFSETISPLMGRWALAWFYLAAARHLTGHWRDMVDQLIGHHVPLPQLALLVILILVFSGILSLVFGYQARHGAVMLFGLTIGAAVVLHDYWHIADPALRQAEMEIFARDVGICGGLLLLVGLGPGPFSIDGKVASAGSKKK